MSEFFDFIFGATEGGFVRLALMSKEKKFNDQYYRWPQDRDKIIGCTVAKNKGDVYFCPSLFSKAQGTKDNTLGSSVSWVDLDKSSGLQTAKENEWSALVASGSPGHAHAYRSLGGISAPRDVETLNRVWTRTFDGDRSGWDAEQLLRVPDTFNYKTNPPKPVKLLSLDTARTWSISELSETDLQAPPAPLPFEEVELSEVLLQHNLSTTIRQLLAQHPLECFDRSSALFRLASLSFESGLDRGSTYALIEFADRRWGKFSGRDDKQLRLTEIINRVFEGREATELPQFSERNQERRISTEPVGIITLQKITGKIEWVITDLIRSKGMTLIIGDTGEGKSTFALNMAIRIAGGFTNFLQFPIEKQDERILYASHEMSREEINTFTLPMTEHDPFTSLHEKLDQNIRINATGYTIPLDLESGQKIYEGLLDEGGYTGLIIDTLAASVSSSLSEEKPMRQIVDWLDKIRDRYGIWILVLHHLRKNSQTVRKAKREVNVDDAYGAGLIAQRANQVFYYTRTSFISKKARFGNGSHAVPLIYTGTGWIERGTGTVASATDTAVELPRGEDWQGGRSTAF